MTVERLLVDTTVLAGILGGFEGSKARRVLIPNEAALHAHLNPGAPVHAGAGIPAEQAGMGGF